jgi:cyclopropane fatty-acyl-phospholipid synthase-like methyltransferase
VLGPATTHPSKPFSQACEENRNHILSVLAPYLANARSLLEVGSGTGQHAAYFAAKLPSVVWQASDLPENLPGIRLWIAEAELPNLPLPVELDVIGQWPKGLFDAVFSANTAHIMSDSEVAAMFRGIPTALAPGGVFALYGPFNYNGDYTSESNARFDRWLKATDPISGIKDFKTLNALAVEGGLLLLKDHEMPANNHMLVWQRPR